MSKTLVIHPDDRSTDFLKLIYANKNYDIINDPNTSRDELRKEISNHDRIIMMGHGTPQGLINTKYWFSYTGVHPYTIDSSFTDLLRDKKTISIWCNSDQFYRMNNLSDGQLHSAMVISEVSEQEYVLGKAYLNADEQLDNMVRYALALNGCIDCETGSEMRDYVLAHYKGTDPVTQYNRNTLLVI